MLLMLVGLILFIGMHSVRIVADDWRTRTLTGLGEIPWKAIYSLVSLAGLVLLVVGYGQARVAMAPLWFPPAWLYHLVAALMIPAFILLAAAYGPDNHIRRAVGHPMVLAVKIWALSHLLVNGRLADLILFGAFLAWAVMLFRASRRRPAGTADAPVSAIATLATVLVGLAAYGVFAIYLHHPLIGVRVIGG